MKLSEPIMDDDTIKKHIHYMNKLEAAQKLVVTSFFTIVMGFGFTVLGVWMFEKPKLYYVNVPFPVIKKVVHAGDVIPVKVERCNTSDEPATYSVTRYLESLDGGTSINMPTTQVIMEPGCKETISLISQVPVEAAPGRYRVRGRAKIDGDVKTFYADWHTEEFEVK